MSCWRKSVLMLAAGAFLLAGAPAYGQKKLKGKRADVRDVSGAVRGEQVRGYGPSNLPRTPRSEDGRLYYYLEAVSVTAIRNRLPARSYSFWPRLTLAADAEDDVVEEMLPVVRDAITLALTDIAQVDWAGEARIDPAVAGDFARERIDAVLGGGVLDAVDFLHIEVQVF